MISISAIKSTSSAAKYFTEHDYYSEKGDGVNSEWFGKGAELLGLEGSVSKEDLIKALDGRVGDDVQLGRLRQGGEIQHKKGWDFTFSAPKSVSVLGLVGGDERLIKAHENAVKKALGFIEKDLVQTRRTIEGVTERKNTGNLVAAQFTHKTSRALDPQLHTHNVVMNMTNDGAEWKSIESKGIYDNSKMAGHIYQNELAGLVTELGYNIDFDPQKGTFEIKDVPKDLLQAFSKRRQEVLKAADEFGYKTAKGMDKAAVRSREGKVSTNEDELKQSWKDTTKEKGADLEKIIAGADGKNKGVIAPIKRFFEGFKKQKTPLEAVRFAYKNMMYSESAIAKDQLISNALKWDMGSIRIDQVSKAIDDLTKSGELVARTVGGKAGFTSQAEIEKEQKIISIMKDGQGVFKPIATDSFIKASLEDQGLTKGQYDSAKSILSSKDLVVGVQGYAGTGKTFMLEHVNRIKQAVKDVAGDKRVREFGFAPTGAAAKELEGSGLGTRTIASLLFTLENKKDLSEYRDNLWVVDEASMVDTDSMLSLMGSAEKLDSKVVLVGDKQQLSAIQAGKPFAQMMENGMKTTVMQDIMRQKGNENLLGAVHDSIENKARQAFEKLKDNTVEVQDRGERLERFVADYFKLPESERENTLLLIPDNKTRNEVQDMIREQLKVEGKLAKNGTDFVAHTNANLTPLEKTKGQFYQNGNVVQFHTNQLKLGIKAGDALTVDKVDGNKVSLVNAKGKSITLNTDKVKKMNPRNMDVYKPEVRELAVGDDIRMRKTDKSLGVMNGDKGQVKKIEGSQVTIENKDGSEKTLDLAKFKTWEHGYASTVYTAQGQTVQKAMALIESYRKNLITSKSFYVSISRAKESAQLYTDNKEKAIKGIESRMGEKQSALSKDFLPDFRSQAPEKEMKSEKEAMKQMERDNRREQINKSFDMDR